MSLKSMQEREADSFIIHYRLVKEQFKSIPDTSQNLGELLIKFMLDFYV